MTTIVPINEKYSIGEAKRKANWREEGGCEESDARGLSTEEEYMAVLVILSFAFNEQPLGHNTNLCPLTGTQLRKSAATPKVDPFGSKRVLLVMFIGSRILLLSIASNTFSVTLSTTKAAFEYTGMGR